MYAEIHEAINFLSGFLIGRIPRRKVFLLGEQLANFLVLRFQDRWDPLDPNKDSINRCLKIFHQGVPDPAIKASADAVGLEIEEILSHLPAELEIQINPGDVTYRVGQSGPTNPIYTMTGAGSQNSGNIFHMGPGGDGSGQLRLSCNANQAGANWLVGQAPSPFFELSSLQDAAYTVGSFAMTRFGTTKKKTNNALLKEIQQKFASQGVKQQMNHESYQVRPPVSPYRMNRMPVAPVRPHPQQQHQPPLPRLPLTFVPPGMHQPGPIMPGPSFVQGPPQFRPQYPCPVPPFWTGC